MKGLSENQSAAERTLLITKTDDVEAITKTAQRVAELTKKGYAVVDTVIENNEQSFLLEQKAG